MTTTTTGRPGVSVSETLTPLSTAPTTPGEAVAAFVGTHNAGPVGPTLVTSWSQWKALYGGFGTGSNLLPFAVYEFFANSGSSCYIVRAVASDAAAAAIVLNDAESTPAPVLTLTAISPGVTGNSLYVDIVPGTSGSGRFSLYVRNGSVTSTPVEQYADVSLNPSDSRNLISLLGSSTQGSQYITGTYTGPSTWAAVNAPAAQTGTPLTGGSDGTAAVNLVTATQLLSNIDAILNINLPGVSTYTVINPLISWAATAGNRFLLVDAPAPASTYSATLSGMSGLSPQTAGATNPLTSSSYLAVYGPWLNFADPTSQVPGATRVLPAGGALLALYEQADAAAGPQQPAAGSDYPIAGALSSTATFANSDLDTLNSVGINVIRTAPGSSGLVPMGVRTLSSGMPDRYLSIRRTLMYVRTLLIKESQFAVFRPNNADLWSQLTTRLSDALSTLQQGGVLQGATAQEAFFVTCDATNNTDNSVANGIVNITVGVALNTPAEYITIQIGQMATGGTATATDSLSS